MADNVRVAKYQYKCEMIYINTAKNQSLKIDTLSIKSIKIDHNYRKNHMPVLLVTVSLDKKIIDNMISNKNDNLFSLTVWKYNTLSNDPLDILYFRNKFTYFLPKKLNPNDSIDYAADDQSKEQNFQTITMGLMCIDHINNNKISSSMTVSGTKYDYVKYITSHMNDILIEPFNYNETLDEFIMPSIDSISEILKYINDYRVFYKTPYRYYLDFDSAYIISTSGKSIIKNNEVYDNVTIDIKEIIQLESNEEGIVINKSKGNHTVVVSYVDTEVYGNTITNKSKSELKGVSSTGSVKKSLKSKSSISTNKTQSIRIKDGNDHMLENIESMDNSSNVFIAINKEYIDPSVFTINKRYNINNIDKYRDYNGSYILTRKIEEYKRSENDVYKINLMLYFTKLD